MVVLDRIKAIVSLPFPSFMAHHCQFVAARVSQVSHIKMRMYVTSPRRPLAKATRYQANFMETVHLLSRDRKRCDVDAIVRSGRADLRHRTELMLYRASHRASDKICKTKYRSGSNDRMLNDERIIPNYKGKRLTVRPRP